MNDQNSIIVQQTNSFITPVADIATALHRYQAVKEFISGVLREGVDYGKIPGSDKPTLLKPGAEKMTAFFGFSVRYILEDSVEDWSGKDHDGEPFFYYRYRAQLWRTDQLIAEGEGSCNSWEKKYRYRSQERMCPKCGKANIRHSKDGGWYCWAKTGGCGATFAESDTSIIDQPIGQIKNPDPADLVNTLQKMSQKRALIAPVLIATNTSEYFTQDIEDYITGDVIDAVVHETPVKQTNNSGGAAPYMTLEEAMKEQSDDGTVYGDLSSEELSNKSIGINKGLKKNNLTSDKQDQYIRKLEAIKLILQSRNTTAAVA